MNLILDMPLSDDLHVVTI